MSEIAVRRLKGAAILVIALTGTYALGACKVLTIAEDHALRARLGADFDPRQYVDAVWASKAVPLINAKAAPMPDMLSAIDGGLDKAGAAFGRRAGDGSAWTFALRGEGVVGKVDLDSPHGSVEVALPGGPSGRVVRIQTGPVVSETAIRDALPFVTFNDFADQMAFAEVGRALTAKALTGLTPIRGQLQPGRHIRFVGVANVRDAADPLIVTPVSITVDNPARAL